MNRKISRRQMIKLSSITAASAMITTSMSSAEHEINNIDQDSLTRMDAGTDICFMNATDMAALLRTKKISAREVMQAHLKQIEKINSKVNAFITLVPEDELIKQALAADESLAKGKLTGSFCHGHAPC
jgi:amidase